MSTDSGCYPRYAVGIVSSEVTMVVQDATIASAGEYRVLPSNRDGLRGIAGDTSMLASVLALGVLL